MDKRIKADTKYIEFTMEAGVIYASCLRSFAARPRGNAWSAASIAAEFKY